MHESGKQDILNDKLLIKDSYTYCQEDKRNSYSCDYCREEFMFIFDYLDHQDIHEGKVKLKCTSCTSVCYFLRVNFIYLLFK